MPLPINSKKGMRSNLSPSASGSKIPTPLPLPEPETP